MGNRPGPPVTPNRGYEPDFCPHPADETEWRRDDVGARWVGICRRCGTGPSMLYGNEVIVRTDEQLAHGDVPAIPVIDQYLVTPYEPWIPLLPLIEATG